MGQARRQQNLAGEFQCPACLEWKDPTEYYKNKRTIDGISTYCKDCHRKKQRQVYSKSAEDRRAQQRDAQAYQELQEQLVAYRSQLQDMTSDIASLEVGQEAVITMSGKYYKVVRLAGKMAKDMDLPEIDLDEWNHQRSGHYVTDLISDMVGEKEYVPPFEAPVGERLGPPVDEDLIARGRSLDWMDRDNWTPQDREAYEAYEAWEAQRLREKYGD